MEDEKTNEIIKMARARKGLIDMKNKFSDLLTKALNDVNEKIEHVELLKHEQKREILRLKKQFMGTSKDYERQVSGVQNLHNRVDHFEHKSVATESATAIIFKLLRIQYAL